MLHEHVKWIKCELLGCVGVNKVEPLRNLNKRELENEIYLRLAMMIFLANCLVDGNYHGL